MGNALDKAGAGVELGGLLDSQTVTVKGSHLDTENAYRINFQAKKLRELNVTFEQLPKTNIKMPSKAPVVLDSMSVATSHNENRTRKVLRGLHQQILNSLHIREVVPALFEESLLTDEEKEYMNKPSRSEHEKIDYLLQRLPMKGPGVLVKFISCLRQTADGTGSSHADLATKLEEKIGEKSERISKSPKKRSPKPSYQPYAMRPVTDYLRPRQENKFIDTTLYGTKPIKSFCK